ncbi:MAG: AzlC family ABC transporter permease [Bacilli bacterium]
MSVVALRESQYSAFRLGVWHCLPTVFGYWSIGFACGMIGRESGMTPAEMFLLSLLQYTGSGQFVTASMLASSASVGAIVFTVFLLNIRHILYGAAVAPYCSQWSVWQTTMIGAQLTDETFGVAANTLQGRKHANFYWFLGLNITAYVNWLVATTLGAVFAGVIPSTEAIGMDFALVAMFAGLLAFSFAGQERINNKMVAMIATIFALLALQLVISTSVAVLISMLVGATVGMVSEKWL